MKLIIAVLTMLALAIPAYAADSSRAEKDSNKKLMNPEFYTDCIGDQCTIPESERNAVNRKEKSTAGIGSVSLADDGCVGPTCQLQDMQRRDSLMLQLGGSQDPAGYYSGGAPEDDAIARQEDCRNGSCKVDELLMINQQTETDEESEGTEEDCVGPTCKLEKKKQREDMMGDVVRNDDPTDNGSDSPQADMPAMPGKKANASSSECEGPSCDVKERQKEENLFSRIGIRGGALGEENPHPADVAQPSMPARSGARMPTYNAQAEANERQKRDRTFGRVGRPGNPVDD